MQRALVVQLLSGPLFPVWVGVHAPRVEHHGEVAVREFGGPAQQEWFVAFEVVGDVGVPCFGHQTERRLGEDAVGESGPNSGHVLDADCETDGELALPDALVGRGGEPVGCRPESAADVDASLHDRPHRIELFGSFATTGSNGIGHRRRGSSRIPAGLLDALDDRVAIHIRHSREGVPQR